MISAVFDCMVMLQAATSDRGPAFAALALAESNAVRLYVSPEILAEVRDVLTRPDITAQFPSLTPERVELFLQKLATLAVVVNDPADAGFPLPDQDDLPYLNLAVAANVGYVVSRDTGLAEPEQESSLPQAVPAIAGGGPIWFLEGRQAGGLKGKQGCVGETYLAKYSNRRTGVCGLGAIAVSVEMARKLAKRRRQFRL